jgi:hypothetical protein
MVSPLPAASMACWMRWNGRAWVPFPPAGADAHTYNTFPDICG